MWHALTFLFIFLTVISFSKEPFGIRTALLMDWSDTIASSDVCEHMFVMSGKECVFFTDCDVNIFNQYTSVQYSKDDLLT